MSTAALRSLRNWSSTESAPEAAPRSVVLRAPRSVDGMAVHDLIRRCKPLDENSVYCNLLQASHFRDTSVAAEDENGRLLGFISGYRVPDRPDTLFVWQVAVSAEARGLGLGKRMLKDILERDGHEDIRFMHTTVTPDNAASWGMFKSFARDLDAPLDSTVMFASDVHFEGRHDDEMLIEIGPFGSGADPA
ncbi:MAG TPA: diaminobutyrate acetyltransferase [Pseudomonadales bacterium]|nr:diaminobutyrate acetyltransferase [Pseudomonadales bacterium]